MHYANIYNLAIMSEIKERKKKLTRKSLLIIDDKFALYQKKKNTRREING